MDKDTTLPVQPPSTTTAAPQLYMDLLDRKVSVRKRATKALEAAIEAAPEDELLPQLLAGVLRLRERARAKKAAAIEALGELGQPETLPPICHVVAQQDDHEVLLDAFFPALRKLGQPRDSATIEWLYGLLLRADSLDISERTKDALVHLRGQRQAATCSLATLDLADSVSDMAQAIWLLGALQDARLAPYAVRYLQQSTTRDPLCVASYEALVALGDPDAVAALQRLVEEDLAHPVALGVAAALCALGHEDGAPLLVRELLDHPRRTPPDTMLKALARLPTDAFYPLFLEFASPEGNSYHARMAAFAALGHRKAREALPMFMSILQDGSEYYSIHNAAAIALAQISPETPHAARDNRLRNLLTMDLEARQDGHTDMFALLQALQDIAEASTKLLTAAPADADMPHLANLRERNKATIPTLLEYQHITHAAKRFAERRGRTFLPLVDACVSAWQALNESLNQFEIRSNVAVDPEAFSALRGLLAKEPSPRTWEAIRAALDKWPSGDDLLVALAYADQHLESWPDALRVVPYHWRQDLLSQQYQPRLQVARNLEFSGMVRMQQKLISAITRLPEDHPFTCLDVQQNAFASSFAKALSALPALARFRSLNLFYNNIGAKGLIHLLESPHCKQLESLNVRSNNIGNKGVLLLAKATGFDQLRHLNLCSNRISATGVIALAASSAFPSLQTLDLTANYIPEEAREALEEAPQWQDVTILLDDLVAS